MAMCTTSHWIQSMLVKIWLQIKINIQIRQQKHQNPGPGKPKQIKSKQISIKPPKKKSIWHFFGVRDKNRIWNPGRVGGFLSIFLTSSPMSSSPNALDPFPYVFSPSNKNRQPRLLLGSIMLSKNKTRLLVLHDSTKRGDARTSFVCFFEIHNHQ